MRGFARIGDERRLLLAVVVAGALVAGALAVWLAPAASAVPGDQLWTTNWPSPDVPGYEIRSSSVVVRGPGGDLWVANTGMAGSTRDRNYVLLRYAPTGALRWELETGSANQGHEYASDVVVAADGSAVVTGDLMPQGVWTVKVSAQGKRLWSKKLVSAVAGGAASAAAIALDSRRNAYVVGARQRAGHGQDVMLAKYSPKGALLWTRYLSAGGHGDDLGTDVVIDGADRVFVSGTVQTLHKGKDALIARFTTTGALVWKRVWNSSGANDDGASALAVSKARVVVAGGSGPSGGESRGLVLTAKRTMRSSDGLKRRLSPIPGWSLWWESVAVNGSGDIAAGGTANVGPSSHEFAYALWPGDGSTATFQHYTPIGGYAYCHKVWLTAGGTLYATGYTNTGSAAGMSLVSQAAAPHGWTRGTNDYGDGTSLAASADGVCVAGMIGDHVTLWMYEP